MWDVVGNKKASIDLNKMKPSLLKRFLQLPNSTPSDAVLYEFGMNDLSLDILMEKVILAVETLSRVDEIERLAKKLLTSLLAKNVPGFCSELQEACGLLGVSLSDLIGEKDVRKLLKMKVVKIQAEELYKRMMLSSKMDGILLNGFQFSGKPKKYLSELDFDEARVVFMVRYRMLPSKSNFPGRWSGTACNICGFDDTDAHLFHCPGYQDLIPENVTYDMFWNNEVLNDTERLRHAAGAALGIVERLEEIQNMDFKKCC